MRPLTKEASVTPDDERAKLLVNELMDLLNNRRGFPYWWDEIGSENRADIKRKMRATVKRALVARRQEPTR